MVSMLLPLLQQLTELLTQHSATIVRTSTELRDQVYNNIYMHIGFKYGLPHYGIDYSFSGHRSMEEDIRPRQSAAD